MILSNSAGRSGFSLTAGVGVPSKMALKITPELSPRNGNAPVAISYSTAPKENKSVRASSFLARTCSGDMYATVPSAKPGLVRWDSTSMVVAFASALAPCFTESLANPKSRIFACPRLVMKVLAGLMSRWTMPSAWAASSASAISIPTESTVSTSNGLPAMRCFRVMPSRNSMTMKG